MTSINSISPLATRFYTSQVQARKVEKQAAAPFSCQDSFVSRASEHNLRFGGPPKSSPEEQMKKEIKQLEKRGRSGGPVNLFAIGEQISRLKRQLMNLKEKTENTPLFTKDELKAVHSFLDSL